MGLLLLPHESGFQEILATPPPSPNRTDFVVRAGGLLIEAVDQKELNEYLKGGEYEERMQEIDDDSLLWLPEDLEVEWED
jgi:hypothetical protein